MRVSSAPVCAGCGAERVCAYRGDPARAGQPGSGGGALHPRLAPGALASIRMRTPRCWREWRASCGGASRKSRTEDLMRRLTESLSLSVQMTESKAYLAESLPRRSRGADAPLCRPASQGARSAAERAGRDPGQDADRVRAGRVWDLLRKRIAASEYTRPGDPLRIDVGYRPKRNYPHVSRGKFGAGRGDGQGAGVPPRGGLRAGVERVEKAQLELTAVIEPAARLGATDEEPERAADVPLWRGDDGGAPGSGC